MADTPSRRAILAGIATAGTAELAPFLRQAKAQAATAAGPIELAYPAFEALAKAHDDACRSSLAAENRYEEPPVPTTRLGVKIKVDDASVELMRADIAKPFDPSKPEPGSMRWNWHFHQQHVRRTRKALAQAEKHRAECRCRADAAGLTAALQAEKRADEIAGTLARELLAKEPTTLREAAFQAAIIEHGCYDDPDRDIYRLMKDIIRLAGIPLYWRVEG